jgi:peptidoglycan pentaglycine glycine transferase (the first glycine)
LQGKYSWNDLLGTFPFPHLLQTAQWAELKSRFGWQAHYLLWIQAKDRLALHYSPDGWFDDPNPRAAALVLERRVLPGVSVMYLPKGPTLLDWDDVGLVEEVLRDLEEFTRGFGALQLKIDPDVILGVGVPGAEDEKAHPGGQLLQKILDTRGWRFSAEQIQFRNTVWVDLIPAEDEILARMKSKTRYNIRLAGRKGITVRPGTKGDLANLYWMYADTSIRAGFTIRGEDYYLTLWQMFLDESLQPSLDPIACPLLAEYQDQPIAGAVIFRLGKKAWYLHGMSLPEHSEKMAPHLVQWEAIRWAKSQGCSLYDMWGAPDEFVESDPLWGVYRFKSGYGGQVIRTIGAWDYSPKPKLYALYNRTLPHLLDAMRWFGNRRTQHAAEGGI